MAADQMADVQLGQLVVGEVQRLQTAVGQVLEHAGHVLAALDLHADKHMGGARVGVAVVEFGDVAAAHQRTELFKAARLLGQGDRQNRLALLAQLGALGDVAQAVKIHIGAAGHGNQRLAAELFALGVQLKARHGGGAGRLQNGAGVFKHVFQRGADLVGVHQDHFVQQLAAQAEGFFAHQLHRDAVGKQAHVFQLHPMAGGNRAVHGVGIHRLHANDFDFRLQALDIRGHARSQAAAADGDKHGVDRVGVLAQDFHADGALAGDHVRVVIRMDKGHAVFGFQLFGVQVGIGKRFTMQHHLAAAPRHAVDFHLRGGHRHDDGGFAAQPLRRQRHALGVVAGRGGNHPALALLGGELGHFVVGAAQLEREHRLQVFALEQNGVVQAARQAGGRVQRGFDGHVVDAGGEDAFEVVVLHVGSQGRRRIKAAKSAMTSRLAGKCNDGQCRSATKCRTADGVWCSGGG